MESFEVIAAFLDGERVDPHALKEALVSDEARQYLVDVVALREITADRPAATATALARVVSLRVQWIRRATAAAAVLVCVIGAYVVGHRSADLRVPLSSAPASVADGPGRASMRPVSAPLPTSVIRFERGVDWTETGGGD